MQRAVVFAVCCVLIGSVSKTEAQGANQMAVKINGVAISGVRNVTGLNAVLKEDKVQQATTRQGIGQTPAGGQADSIVITRAATNDATLFQWHKNVAQGKQDRRTVSVTLLNNAGEAVRTVNLKSCWPEKYVAPAPAEQKSGVGKEKIVLTCESAQLK